MYMYTYIHSYGILVRTDDNRTEGVTRNPVREESYFHAANSSAPLL